ncbi:MAG: class I SAM-dependent methyltransferase [Thermoplasmata archaeon]|nr:MAG: class I SAM-dependent methyltransferase [Thermoplasmata archaeon]
MKTQNKNLEIKTFDEITEGKGYSEATEENYRDLLQHLLSDIKNKPKMRVLDVGCGTGGNSIRLAKLSYSITGIDISSKAIVQAKAKVKQLGLKDIDFCVGDIENLCYNDNTFDICFCGGVLHHFPDLKRVAEELYRVTKKNGKVLAYDPNALHLYVFVVHNIINRAINLQGFSPNERALKPKELMTVFKTAGFMNFNFDSYVLSTKKTEWKLIRNLSYTALDKTFSGLRKGNILTMICEKT